MRETDVETNIVIDTSPLLAICAACGHFEVLKCCYNQVLVPYKAKGYPIQIRNAISRMCERGIWLSEDVTIEALRLADE